MRRSTPWSWTATRISPPRSRTRRLAQSSPRRRWVLARGLACAATCTGGRGGGASRSNWTRRHRRSNAARGGPPSDEFRSMRVAAWFIWSGTACPAGTPTSYGSSPSTAHNRRVSSPSSATTRPFPWSPLPTASPSVPIGGGTRTTAAETTGVTTSTCVSVSWNHPQYPWGRYGRPVQEIRWRPPAEQEPVAPRNVLEARCGAAGTGRPLRLHPGGPKGEGLQGHLPEQGRRDEGVPPEVRLDREHLHRP